MIIYSAKNKITQHIYIGATRGTLAKRKSNHESDAKRSTHTKRPLLIAIRQYGKENFSWTILHDNITSIEKLSELERSYIQITKPEYNASNVGYPKKPRSY